MYKLVIFDFDGTIADTRSIYFDCFSRLAKKHNIEQPTKEEIEKLGNMSIRKRLKYFGVPIYKLPKLIKEAMEIYEESTSKAPLFDEIKELLYELKGKGYIITVVSSNSLTNINNCFSYHNLDCFDHIYGRAPIFNKYRTVKKMINKHKMNLEDCIYVGDELRDIEACKKINLKIASASWGYDHIELLEKGSPDYLVCKPSELREILINE